MPSVIESPSGRVPEKAPRWDLTGIEDCGGRKVFWWMPLLVWEYLGIYSARIRVGGIPRGPQALRAPPRARLGGLWPPWEALMRLELCRYFPKEEGMMQHIYGRYFPGR